METERIILSNLIFNEEFGRITIPFLKAEYFADDSERVLFQICYDYVSKYNTFPTTEAIFIELSKVTSLPEDVFRNSKSILNSLQASTLDQLPWLYDTTENWCKERGRHIALQKIIAIHSDKNSTLKGTILQLLMDAEAICFDTHVGHDFLEDSDERYENYHRKETKVPFDLYYLNEITRGGVSNKTFNIIMAGPGIGKTLFMCHCAAAQLSLGYKVLYITLEMAEERIAERIDANLLNIAVNDLVHLTKDGFKKRLEKIKESTNGRLIIKEYPTTCAGASNFRYLIRELRVKKNFKPDIIYIDYINICASSRVTLKSGINSYGYIKAIAEELRGLAVEHNVPVISATQVNREGWKSSEIGMENTAESFALPATCDLMFALTASKDLIELGQIQVSQLKNRYNDVNKNKNFILGIDTDRMKFYDVENCAQNIVNGPEVVNENKFKNFL